MSGLRRNLLSPRVAGLALTVMLVGPGASRAAEPAPSEDAAVPPNLAAPAPDDAAAAEPDPKAAAAPNLTVRRVHFRGTRGMRSQALAPMKPSAIPIGMASSRSE